MSYRGKQPTTLSFLNYFVTLVRLQYSTRPYGMSTKKVRVLVTSSTVGCGGKGNKLCDKFNNTNIMLRNNQTMSKKPAAKGLGSRGPYAQKMSADLKGVFKIPVQGEDVGEGLEDLKNLKANVIAWQKQLGHIVQTTGCVEGCKMTCPMCGVVIVLTGQRGKRMFVKQVRYHLQSSRCGQATPLDLGMALINAETYVIDYPPLIRVMNNFKDSEHGRVISFEDEDEDKKSGPKPPTDHRPYRVLYSTKPEELQIRDNAGLGMTPKELKAMEDTAMNNREMEDLLKYLKYWIGQSFGFGESFDEGVLYISNLSLIKNGTEKQANHTDVANLFWEKNKPNKPTPTPGVLIIPLQEYREILLLDRANKQGRNLFRIKRGKALWMNGDFIHAGAEHDTPCVCLHVIVDHRDFQRDGNVIDLFPSFDVIDETSFTKVGCESELERLKVIKEDGMKKPKKGTYKKRKG
jgi:hypothetical protein